MRPAERAARIDAYRDARRARSAGIALVSVGGTFTPLGIAMLVDAVNRPAGGDNFATGMAAPIGSVSLAIGGLSLAIGIPLLVHGLSAEKPAAMPVVQIGTNRASLVWSF